MRWNAGRFEHDRDNVEALAMNAHDFLKDQGSALGARAALRSFSRAAVWSI